MQFNMLEAKSKLSSLVAAAEQGEEIILARDGIPVAKIVKYDKPKLHPPGAWRRLSPMSADWNSAETNAQIERLFYGETPHSGGTSRAPSRKRTRTRGKVTKKK